MRRIIAKAALLLMLPALATAQNTDHRSRGLAYVFVGAGTHQMGLTAGFGGEGYVYKGLAMGLEVGTAGVGTSTNGNPNWIGLGSADASYHFFPKKLPGRAAPLWRAVTQISSGKTSFCSTRGPGRREILSMASTSGAASTSSRRSILACASTFATTPTAAASSGHHSPALLSSVSWPSASG